MEKLRKDDFLLSYYLAPGGTTLWVTERQGEIFLQGIIGNRSYLCEHLAGGENRDIAAGIRAAYGVLGLTEFAVYSSFDRINLDDKKRLQDQFDIFDQEIRKAREARTQQPVDEGNDQQDEDEAEDATPQPVLEKIKG